DARRRASVPALAAPCPLASMRRRRFDASCDDSIELNASNHSGASERGEPRREGRLWRSRRKSGSRGEEPLVDDEAARGTRSPTQFAPLEALRAAAHRASKRLEQDEKKPRNTAWLEMHCGLVEALLHVQRLHRLAKRIHCFLMLAGFVECFPVGALLLHFVQLRRRELRILGERCIDLRHISRAVKCKRASGRKNRGGGKRNYSIIH